MSVATNRLSLEQALAAASCVVQMWGMTGQDVMLVGSARRQRPDVGDLEFTCRRPAEDEPDALYERMADTVSVPGGLFGSDAKVGRALKGFSPGFGYCDIVMDLNDGARDYSVRVQVHRWEPDGSNRGWIELMRTGPGEFGEWFLRAWKSRWHIGAGKASIDGHLVGPQGNRIRVPTEAECFRQCGMNYIEPDRRDAFVQTTAVQGRKLERWKLR